MVGSGLVGFLVALAGVGAAGRAHAEDAPRLDYLLGDGATACPSEPEFRAAVAARFGRDPFVPGSKRALTVRIQLENGKLVATGKLVETDGSAAGLRRLTGEPDGCRELADGMALAVSLAVSAALGEILTDPPLLPPVVAAPAASAPPPASAPPNAAPPPPAAPAPSAERHDDVAGASADERSTARLVFGAGVAVHAAFGVGPGTGAGGALILRGRFADWSVAVEGRIDGLSRAPFDTGGSVTTTLLAGVLAPCRHFGVVPLCALGLAGSIRAESTGVAAPGSDSAPYAAAGARLGLELPLADALLLQGRLDGLVTLIPVDIEFAGETAWSSLPYSAALGVGVLGLFP